MGWAIAALLLGFVIFGFLRAPAVVGETWDVPRPRWFVGTIATVIALTFLIFVSESVFGAIVGGAVLGVALYGGWRLRRVSITRSAKSPMVAAASRSRRHR